MLNSIVQDASFLLLLLCISGALLVIALIRMFLLARHNRRLRQETVKMQKLAAEQHLGIISTQHDVSSWRAKTQRQFDALRAELAARLDQSERSNQHAQKQLDELEQQEKETTQAKLSRMEAAACALPKQIDTPSVKITMPTLPAMETLRIESLESELAATKSALTGILQQNAALRLTSLMARRRQPAPRRGAARPVRHG